MWEEIGVLEDSISELLKLHRTLDSLGEKYNLPKKVIHDANIVMEEALVNIINYAYENKEEKHKILFRLKIENGELVLNIEDDGKPFNPLSVPEPDINVPVEEREIGGLGVYLIRQLAKSVSYARHDTKNILTIKISIDHNK